ncbi:MAG: fused MFS/spermidine synthase [Bacteroidetes bacterium]|nr:fused MFS/spermidine synthase [Bacteroidota bacterium]
MNLTLGIFKPNRNLLVLAFIEGAAVMAVELFGAKMISPFYGSSLYVWSAVIGVTLGGLAVGYFIGGNLSTSSPGKNTLYLILILSALLVALMPFSSKLIMESTLNMEIRTGIFISCIVFLLPPLITFGMVSPMIIQLLSRDLAEVGKAAGFVYGISTVGGIIATFSFAFYVIPYQGTLISALATAIALFILPALLFILKR